MKLSAVSHQLSARNKARVKGNQEQRQSQNPHRPTSTQTSPPGTQKSTHTKTQRRKGHKGKQGQGEEE